MLNDATISNDLTAVDLYAGAGGSTQGLTDAGFCVVGAVENDTDAAATLRRNHPSFPADYRFCGSHASVERQIGNALPVQLAYALGCVVRQLLHAGSVSEALRGAA